MNGEGNSILTPCNGNVSVTMLTVSWDDVASFIETVEGDLELFDEHEWKWHHIMDIHVFSKTLLKLLKVLNFLDCMLHALVTFIANTM